MGKALRKLMKKVRGEKSDIESASKKRGLWANIGMGLGGLLAMGLITGGAASPLVAGLMAAGGTYAGGKLGDILARQTKLGGSGRIKGGRFFQEERESLISQLGEKIGAGALKSGLMAGMTQFKALGGLKEGGGFKKIFEKGAGAQTEGFGKLFDFKGSFIGESLEKGKVAREAAALTKAATAAGKEAELGGFLSREADFATEFGVGGGSESKRFAQSMNQPIDVSEFTTQSPISEEALSYEFGPEGGSGTTLSGERGIFGEDELYDWSGDIEDIGSRPSAYDIQQSQRSAMEQLLSSPENRQQYGKALYQEGSVLGDDITRDIMADYADKGFEMPAHTSEKENIFDRWSGDISAQSDLALAKRGADLQRPDVPVATEDTFLTKGEQIMEDAYKTLDVDQPGYSDMRVNRAFKKLQDYNASQNIADPGFSVFDEASWEEGSRKLSNIDFGLADEQIPWQKRFFPSDKSGKPGGFDPRY